MRKYFLIKISSCLMVLALAILSVLLPFITFENKIKEENFPESYIPYLRTLSKKYPYWDFEAYHTGLQWSEVIVEEMTLGRNLVENNHPNVPNSWKSIQEGAYDWEKNNWISLSGDKYVQASREVIRYFIDPRNFLNEENIFQFESLSYTDTQSINVIETILQGSFMDGKEIENGITYAKAFLEIGKKNNISPYLLVNRVLQEQSHAGTSPLISGNYSGYEGYYNYFNIKASGETQNEVIENGLIKAKEEGWNTIYKSLEGGAVFLAENYISKGQDTLYLQKFDVESDNHGLYWHQYMQALYGAYNEGNTAGRAYDELNIKNRRFKFKIPVYENMPEFACEKPV